MYAEGGDFASELFVEDVGLDDAELKRRFLRFWVCMSRRSV